MTASATPRGRFVAGALAALLVACRVEGDLGGVRATPICDASCDDACVDLATDRVHCGACGVVCADDEGCVEGGCVLQWPTRWRVVAQTRPGEQFDNGWRYVGGACLPPTRVALPDGGTALALRADWGQIATDDPTGSHEAVARAWVWRVLVDPPLDRQWAMHGFARTRTGPNGFVDYNGTGFVLESRQPGQIGWWSDGIVQHTTPFETGRVVDMRVEVNARRTRTRALLDGMVQWDGPTEANDWSDRNRWSLNVFRGGGLAGCGQGRLFVTELRAEVAP